MKINTICPFCRGKLSIGSKYAGQTIACPGCQNRITVRPLPPSTVEERESPKVLKQEAKPTQPLDEVLEDLESQPTESSLSEDWFAEERDSADTINQTDDVEDDFEDLPLPVLRRQSSHQGLDVLNVRETDNTSTSRTRSSWLLPVVVGLIGIVVGFPIGYLLGRKVEPERKKSADVAVFSPVHDGVKVSHIQKRNSA